MAFNLTTWRRLCMASWLVAARNLEARTGSAIVSRLSSSSSKRVTNDELTGSGKKSGLMRDESNTIVKKASAAAGITDRGIALLRDPKINKVSPRLYHEIAFRCKQLEFPISRKLHESACMCSVYRGRPNFLCGFIALSLWHVICAFQA